MSSLLSRATSSGYGLLAFFFFFFLLFQGKHIVDDCSGSINIGPPHGFLFTLLLLPENKGKVESDSPGAKALSNHDIYQT